MESMGIECLECAPRRLGAWNARRGEGFRNFEDIQTQKTILTSKKKKKNYKQNPNRLPFKEFGIFSKSRRDDEYEVPIFKG